MTGLSLAQAVAAPGATVVRTQSTRVSLLQPSRIQPLRPDLGGVLLVCAHGQRCECGAAASRPPMKISVPGGEGTYYTTALGIDGRASTPTPIIVDATTERALVSWSATETSWRASRVPTARPSPAGQSTGRLTGPGAPTPSPTRSTRSAPTLAEQQGSPLVRRAHLNPSSTPAKALDGTTTGSPTNGTAFGSLPGTAAFRSSAPNRRNRQRDQHGQRCWRPARAVDGNTSGDTAAGSVAIASQVGGAAAPTGTVTNLAHNGRDRSAVERLRANLASVGCDRRQYRKHHRVDHVHQAVRGRMVANRPRRLTADQQPADLAAN